MSNTGLSIFLLQAVGWLLPWSVLILHAQRHAFDQREWSHRDYSLVSTCAFIRRLLATKICSRVAVNQTVSSPVSTRDWSLNFQKLLNFGCKDESTGQLLGFVSVGSVKITDQWSIHSFIGLSPQNGAQTSGQLSRNEETLSKSIPAKKLRKNITVTFISLFSGKHKLATNSWLESSHEYQSR